MQVCSPLDHVLNNTLQDILARRARMTRHEVLWLPGTDHAGIATQTVVERRLRAEEKHCGIINEQPPDSLDLEEGKKGEPFLLAA